MITKRLANKQINADELPDGFDLNYEYFMEHGALVLICDYRIKTGQTDYHENVEKMLQTLTVTQDAS